MDKVKFCLIALLLFSTGSFTGFAQKRIVEVTGRTMDEKGVPISNAIVTFYAPPCPNCIDNILPFSVSELDGSFSIDASLISLKGLKLFIREHVPVGFWSPFGGPPFYNFQHISLFRGVPIHISKGIKSNNINIDLGDVVVPIRWSKVIISLPEVLGQDYVPSKYAASSLKMTLRDNKGNIIYNNRLPEAAFNSTFSSVNLSLTKGSWIVKFSSSDQQKEILSPLLFINIKSLDCTKVILIKNMQRQEPCK